MHTILVPVDGSDHALKALHIACDLAEKYGGRISLLHVVSKARWASELLGMEIASTFDTELKEALLEVAARASGAPSYDLLKAVGEKILEQAAARVRRRGIEVDVLDMESGDPAECILIAHQRTGASTIVMGCRGARASGEGSFGSVSSTVFARAECTCLSVK